MRIFKKIFGWIPSILFGLMFNLQWIVPVWIFLGLHFWLGISIKWFVGCMALWVLIISLRVFVFGSFVSAGNYKDSPKENKNPYSAKAYKPTKRTKNDNIND